MEPIEAHPLIRQNRVIVVPGVYDALSARIAERAGILQPVRSVRVSPPAKNVTQC